MMRVTVLGKSQLLILRLNPFDCVVPSITVDADDDFFIQSICARCGVRHEQTACDRQLCCRSEVRTLVPTVTSLPLYEDRSYPLIASLDV